MVWELPIKKLLLTSCCAVVSNKRMRCVADRGEQSLVEQTTYHLRLRTLTWILLVVQPDSERATNTNFRSDEKTYGCKRQCQFTLVDPEFNTFQLVLNIIQVNKINFLLVHQRSLCLVVQIMKSNAKWQQLLKLLNLDLNLSFICWYPCQIIEWSPNFHCTKTTKYINVFYENQMVILENKSLTFIPMSLKN